MDTLFDTRPSGALFVCRVVLGIVMFAHGAQKLFGWFGGPGYDATIATFTTDMGIPAWMAVLVILAESLGGLGLIFGAFARIAAAGIVAVMAGAVFMVHLENGFFMNWGGGAAGEGFEYHLLALALAGIVLVEGAGAWSVDLALAQLLRSEPRKAAEIR
ncbi:MAG: DoxX family protein [Pseudomonadota bacterium]|nr:DoxX family protein [Pseudomonadota bacterium]